MNLILSAIFLQASADTGDRAIVIDNSNISTNLTEADLSWIDPGPIFARGEGSLSIPGSSVNEVDLYLKNGSLEGKITTTNGKTISGKIRNLGCASISGYTESAMFTLNLVDAKKIVIQRPYYYRFVLDKCVIFDTKSVHEDTDYASMSVSVNKKKSKDSPVSTYLGDVNNGEHKIDLELGPIPIFPDPNIPVALGFEIVNAGHNANSSTQSSIKEGVGIGAAAITEEFAPGAGALAAYAASELVDLFIADCDGPLAVDRIATNGAELAQWTSRGPYYVTTNYGGPYQTLCNTHGWEYNVTWHVERVDDNNNGYSGNDNSNSVSSNGNSNSVSSNGNSNSVSSNDNSNSVSSNGNSNSVSSNDNSNIESSNDNGNSGGS